MSLSNEILLAARSLVRLMEDETSTPAQVEAAMFKLKRLVA